MQYKEVLSYFNVKKQMTEGSAQCICPAHKDNRASLTISQGDGKILMHCHAGCRTEDILGAVGLKMRDLYPGKLQEGSNTSNAEAWKRFVEAREGAKIEGIYHYRNQQDEYSFTRIRLEGKRFIIGRVQDGKFAYGLDGQDRSGAVYGSPAGHIQFAVRIGKPVFYCEGEKDVDAMVSRGFTALTCGSSADWCEKAADVLMGADVVILEDNDSAGRRSSETIAEDLKKTARCVTIFTPMPHLEHGDISDFFDKYAAEELWDFVKGRGRIVYVNRAQFHKFDKDDEVKSVYDYRIFTFLKKHTALFVMGGVPYVYSDGCFKADLSGTELLTKIRKCIFPAFITYSTIKRVYDLILSDADLQIRSEDLNNYPAEWICFKNGFYDPVNRRIIPHSPRYRAVNQIPHDYDPTQIVEGPAIEDWMSFICEDPEDREMLLQFVGYCMTRDTRQQKFLILNGEGGTGKSTLIKLVELIIGSSNISNVSLLQLTQRFSPFQLLGKLLNSCADLEVKALDDTSILKKVLGEDSMMAEAKGKDMVPFKSYAKLLFSTNEIPIVKGEKTNAFFRRLMIVKMDRRPAKKDPCYFESLAGEIDYLIHLCVEALERMYANGTIFESKASMVMVQRLREESDTVESFLKRGVIQDSDARTMPKDAFASYEAFCRSEGRRPLQKTMFYKSLGMKGVVKVKSNGIDYYKGFIVKTDYNDIS